MLRGCLLTFGIIFCVSFLVIVLVDESKLATNIFPRRFDDSLQQRIAFIKPDPGKLESSPTETLTSLPDDVSETLGSLNASDIPNSKVEGQIPFSVCPLPKFDAWDEDIMKYYNPLTNKLANCNKSFKKITELVNGVLKKSESDAFCWGRCLNRKTDWVNSPGEWKEVVPKSLFNSEVRYDCDIVESRCSETNNITSSNYGMLHSQIVENEKLKEERKSLLQKSPVKKYSVHVILIDSTAATQAERNFPKTLAYLEKSMKGISFPYVNKVAMNSLPNAVPILFGKRVERVERAIFDLPSLEPEFLQQKRCKEFVDDETLLMKEFNKEGYVSMFSDDWSVGPVHWPHCKGWDKQPTDHYFKPYLIANEKAPKPLGETNTEKNCIDKHKDVLHYVKSFINSYDGLPKFSWNWFNIGHNTFNDAIRSDTDFYKFFIDNRKKLDDSFIFFIADHGLRFGKVLTTKLGSIEVNNPMWTLTVPKDLRDNEDLMRTMRENTEILLSTYDERATFMDILKYQIPSNWTDRSYLQMKNEEGQSVLRKIRGERSCRSLPIPLEYCICQYPTEDLKSDSEIALELGKALVKHANSMITERNLTSKCAVWEFEKVALISTWTPENKTNSYKIEVKTKAPHPGHFKAVVRRRSLNDYNFSRLDRVDRIDKRGRCVDALNELICDCLKQ